MIFLRNTEKWLDGVYDYFSLCNKRHLTNFLSVWARKLKWIFRLKIKKFRYLTAFKIILESTYGWDEVIISLQTVSDVHKLAINHKKKTSKRVTTPTDGLVVKMMRKKCDIWTTSHILRNDKFGMVEPVKIVKCGWSSRVLYKVDVASAPTVFHMYIPWRGAFSKILGLFRIVSRRQATRRDRINKSENPRHGILKIR